MTDTEQLATVDDRLHAMLAFAAGVRERDGRAVVEEDEDIPRLRRDRDALLARIAEAANAEAP